MIPHRPASVAPTAYDPRTAPRPGRHAPSALPAWIATLLLATVAALSAGCASLPHHDPLSIDVAGIETLPGEGMELRLAVKLRVQNPNDSAIDYRGAALQMSLNGRRLATGVSDVAGTVPRYGETVLTIPVTVSALDVARQVAALADGDGGADWHYRIEGKLEGGLFGTRRFGDSGTLDLSRELGPSDGR
ncbi:LEA type 2 family protein [Marilutibacter chinensis]|uniref:LEA type 2 family protein n=1 Tax=Marilutibacter chinensis TaxID=2912247 RepID=A0ABS9HNW6_9GAMM|nr:LEA type 2 family protein [Lysobacter chinensis]MCF7220679.1 LEA type 2 family protein [Lysobacter chinensis]